MKITTKIKKGIIGALVVVLGVVSLSSYTADAQFLTQDGNIGTVPNIAALDLIPKPVRDSNLLGLFSNSLGFLNNSYNILFRNYGSAILDQFVAFNNASFDNLFVGFSGPQTFTDTDAKLQVDGRIVIGALADPTAPPLEEVCVNDFGKFERCSVTVPSGQCGAANGVTTATEPTTDLCAVGTPSAVSLASGSYGWVCVAAGGTSTCSAPQDAPVCPAPTLTSLEMGTPGNVNYTLNGGDVTGVQFFRSSDNQATWASQGSPSLAQPGLAVVLDGNYIRAQAHCSDGSISDYSNVLQYVAGAGACEGTYTTSGTSQKVDWEGNALNWQQDVFYNDDKEPIYRCSSGYIPANVDIYHTTSAPYMTSSGSDLTDNYYCEYIGGTNWATPTGSVSCTLDGSGNWMISGAHTSMIPNNIVQGWVCAYNYTSQSRLWSPDTSGNWSRYWLLGGSGFGPGYVAEKNGYQGALTATVGGGVTMQCSNLTSYGQSYCETNPANAGCTWNPNG